jgi:hypothetical protein
MKIMVALMLAASLMACGGKSKQSSTPVTTDTETTPPEGTGGATYGGPSAPDAGAR